ncbi:MAG: TIGR02302 family protein, partial [Hyphomicrobiaceae bacterium]
YEDTWSAPVHDPVTAHLWQAHKTRLARLLGRLAVAGPRPRTDRHDPFAARAALLLVAVLLLALAGDSARDRLMAAFRLTPAPTVLEARLDAWVTPPAYTAKPPLMLADGGRIAAASASAQNGAVEVPDRSLLIVRTSGPNLGRLRLVVTDESGAAQTVEAAEDAGTNSVAEVRFDLRRTVTVRVLSGSAELTRWPLTVIPDEPPKIALTKEPERTLRGSVKLSYKMEDDYGVASAEARLERLPVYAGDPRTSWARPEKLKGPRPPLERPPRMMLRVPPSRAKSNEVTSHHELGAHPWAGLRVRMTLVARDHAGNVGKSQPSEIVLPSRRFHKPLARAVIEQRRKLAFDPRHRPEVIKALAALTLAPEEYFTDRHVYLGLRSAFYRLHGDRPSRGEDRSEENGQLRRLSRAGFKSVIDQLWHVALRIEDGGNLSEAERRLREIQDRLSKALEEGATDAEIRKLMQELRQALADFLQQLARQAQNQPMPDGFDPNQQTVRPEDLERMLRNIEQMARQGSRDTAQQMLSQLRDLLDRLQSGRMGRMDQQSRQMMQSLNELGDLINRQQRLMDDTFGEQRRRGQPQDGRRGDKRGERGQRGEKGEEGQQGGQQSESGQLGERQGDLRGRLDRLQRGLRGQGLQPPDQFDEAGEAMDQAQRSLERGNLDEAGRQQGRALDRLRQGAQALSRELQQRLPSRFGQGPAS